MGRPYAMYQFIYSQPLQLRMWLVAQHLSHVVRSILKVNIEFVVRATACSGKGSEVTRSEVGRADI